MMRLSRALVACHLPLNGGARAISGKSAQAWARVAPLTPNKSGPHRPEIEMRMRHHQADGEAANSAAFHRPGGLEAHF